MQGLLPIATGVMSSKPCYRVVLLGDGGVGKSGEQ